MIIVISFPVAQRICFLKRADLCRSRTGSSEKCVMKPAIAVGPFLIAIQCHHQCDHTCYGRLLDSRSFRYRDCRTTSEL